MDTRIARSPPEALFTLATDQWTKPFWDAARNRRLVACRCRSCGAFRMPPTPFCPDCLSQEVEWPELSGIGVVFACSIVDRAVTPEMAEALPYAPALVEPPDAPGIRFVTNIVRSPIGAIRIGAPVRVVFDERSDGVVVPRFEVVEGGG